MQGITPFSVFTTLNGLTNIEQIQLGYVSIILDNIQKGTAKIFWQYDMRFLQLQVRNMSNILHKVHSELVILEVFLD